MLSIPEYRVFLASPGDVQQEREIVSELAAEINETFHNPTVRLKIVRWETDTIPGTGPSAQHVIDTQVGEDFDAYIGIFWHRLGTDIGTGDTGAQHELRKGLDRCERDPAVKVLLYWSQLPLDPGKIDVDQLKDLRAFFDSQQRRCLIQRYSSHDEFTQFIRKALNQLLREAETRSVTSAPVVLETRLGHTTQEVVEPQPKASGDVGDEPGLFDLVDDIESTVQTLVQSAERLGNGMNSLVRQVTSQFNALEALQAKGEIEIRIGRCFAKLPPT